MENNRTMKAAVWTAYGAPEVLQIQDVPRPEPGPNQVLIRVKASTVFAGDSELRRFDVLPMFRVILRLAIGIRKPTRVTTLGQEFAGTVEEVGEQVTRFKPGDEVFGPSTLGFRCNAEYVCVNEADPVTHRPAKLAYGEAAALCVGGLNALYFHRLGNIQAGQKVLFVGAGGSIGTVSIQLAKLAGAEVTAIDTGDKLERLTQLGADHVIDFQRVDLASTATRFDLVFNVHAKSDFRTGLKLLRKRGRLLLMNTYFTQMLASLFVNLFSSKSIKFGIAKYRTEDLDYLAELVATGKLKVVIDREYPLEEIVAAHRYVDSGEKTGSLVINIDAAHAN